LAIKTYTEQLESVQAAIAKIELGSQSFSHKDRSQSKADLATLYIREERLIPLAKKEASGRTGARVRYVETG
jgi:hypothetical protein